MMESMMSKSRSEPSMDKITQVRREAQILVQPTIPLPPPSVEHGSSFVFPNVSDVQVFITWHHCTPTGVSCTIDAGWFIIHVSPFAVKCILQQDIIFYIFMNNLDFELSSELAKSTGYFFFFLKWSISWKTQINLSKCKVT